ncbi:bifunctional nuclease family protein [Saxibacter everestensis]|uniref:Bifunctional nuclease family protein n=1 Tax=Saxibacter everestensis TaxID=2909229 RepID=A0ABY8QW89_9MICO|nr:bifunctional nuclease family protein [Brevibacteriaceae bacterium ZFBP1038]
MQELEVVGVRIEMPANQPVLLLRAKGTPRYLPVWIGAPEANAIALAQQGLTPPRPLTHDLLLNVAEELGAQLESVRVVSMQDKVYFAELVFSGDHTVSSRTSDAIALALRAGCTVYGSDEVLEAGGIEMPEEDEDEVSKFRDFLDHVSADDFESPDD